MLTCKQCDGEKPDDQMVQRGGKAIRLCVDCRNKAIAGNRARGHKKEKSPRKSKVVEPEELRLTVPGGGHGFDAFVTGDDQLQITQENADAASDNVVLSKAEARSIFRMFEEWAAE